MGSCRVLLKSWKKNTGYDFFWQFFMKKLDNLLYLFLTELQSFSSQSATQPFLASSRNAPPHSWGGALRDDTKNGCVANCFPPGQPKIIF